MYSDQSLHESAKFLARKWKTCQQKTWQKQLIASSTETVVPSKNQPLLSTSSLQQHPLTQHQLPRRLQPHQQLLLPPTATTTTATSITSGEEASEDLTEAAATTEDSAVAADRTSIVLQTPRQPEAHPHHPPPHPRHPFLQEHADGIDSSVTKVVSASQTAHASNHSLPLKSRETVKGAGECERGDPLFIINN